MTGSLLRAAAKFTQAHWENADASAEGVTFRVGEKPGQEKTRYNPNHEGVGERDGYGVLTFKVEPPGRTYR